MTPFRNEKNSNREGAYRLPAVVRWPSKVEPGTVSNENMSHLDWFPTLIGEGSLLESCGQRTRALGLDRAVDLLGALPHADVAAAMSGVRSAAVLPVLATCHGGMPTPRRTVRQDSW